MGTFFRQFSDEENKKKSKQIGQRKVALTITGAGVVARKSTFSNNISELLDGAPSAPRWLFDYITVTSWLVADRELIAQVQGDTVPSSPSATLHRTLHSNNPAAPVHHSHCPLPANEPGPMDMSDSSV